MKALILNSGTGSRMGELTKNKPKCLIELGNGETILSRQIRQLNENGIEEFIITVGPFREMITDYVRKEFPNSLIHFVNNPSYDTTNYIYSMFLAKELIDDEIILLHGDIVASDSLFSRFLINAATNSVMVDPTIDLPEKDFKARIENNAVAYISVDITSPQAVFLLPVYKLTYEFMQSWIEVIKKYIDYGKMKVYAEDALNEILCKGKLVLFPWKLTNGFCQEIDTKKDLNVLIEHFNNLTEN